MRKQISKIKYMAVIFSGTVVFALLLGTLKLMASEQLVSTNNLSLVNFYRLAPGILTIIVAMIVMGFGWNHLNSKQRWVVMSLFFAIMLFAIAAAFWR